MNSEIFRLEEPWIATQLFKNSEDTAVRSCLEDVMGVVYADNSNEPQSAMAVLGEFCYVAGQPRTDFFKKIEAFGNKDFMVCVPMAEEWSELIERVYGSRAKKVSRFYTTWQESEETQQKLRQIIASTPVEYQVQSIEETWYNRLKTGNYGEWCYEFIGNYDTYEKFNCFGMGYLLLKDNQPIAGASSYSGFHGGIEVLICTKEDYRRKGLASICGAALINGCVERGWYPNWDAKTRISLNLSQKLGYSFHREYTAYEIVFER